MAREFKTEADIFNWIGSLERSGLYSDQVVIEFVLEREEYNNILSEIREICHISAPKSSHINHLDPVSYSINGHKVKFTLKA